MIIVRLMGGLGNQMFQYAFGRAWSLRHGDSFLLDHSFLEQRENISHTPRDYELSIFKVNVPKANLEEIEKFQRWAGGWRGRLRKYFPALTGTPILLEKNFRFDPSMYGFKGNALAIGYWQSEKYFIDAEETIRKDFDFNPPLSDKNHSLIDSIRSQLSVSMHVRRGDMVHLASAASFHGTCSPVYYRSALEYLKSKLGAFHLYIFSDDPEYVKQTFDFDVPFTIISHNTGRQSFEDMRLMSACQHHIIANSSFSWWGAWLNGSTDKIVIAPKQWFADRSIDTTDIIPERWIRI